MDIPKTLVNTTLLFLAIGFVLGIIGEIDMRVNFANSDTPVTMMLNLPLNIVSYKVLQPIKQKRDRERFLKLEEEAETELSSEELKSEHALDIKTKELAKEEYEAATTKGHSPLYYRLTSYTALSTFVWGVLGISVALILIPLKLIRHQKIN